VKDAGIAKKASMSIRYTGGYCQGWHVPGQCICSWMDGSRATHMYRTYGIRATQEQLPRSSCRGAIADASIHLSGTYYVTD